MGKNEKIQDKTNYFPNQWSDNNTAIHFKIIFIRATLNIHLEESLLNIKIQDGPDKHEG